MLVVKNLPANAGDVRDTGSILGLGRSPGKEYGNPLQYSWLENAMDREAWQVIVHMVGKSQTQLSTHTSKLFSSVQFSSVAQSCPTLCDSMDRSMPGFPVHHELPGAYPNSCPLSWGCHPTISSSVIPFSSCPQSFPASGSFPMSQFFASGGQSIGVSASTSVLPINTQDWSPLGWTGWISL